MPTTRIPIDGLWRCLCPSIDVIGSSLRLRLAPTRTHVLGQTPKPAPFHTSTKRCYESYKPVAKENLELRPNPRYEQRRPGARANERLPRRYQREAAPYKSLSELDALSLPEIHDKLRVLVTQSNSYHSICDLVTYLIVSRGEKPALHHYDALIRANSDAEHGSALVVRDLLREMDELQIRRDSRFYHGMLQVLAIHPDYLLRADVMQEMKERWFGLSPDGWHHLVVGLVRDRQFEMAMDRLDQMRSDGIGLGPWLYDIFVWQLVEFEEYEEAFKMLWYRYENTRFQIQQSVWYMMLDAFARGYHYKGVKFIWTKRVELSRLTPSDGMCTAVLNIAARFADPELGTSAVRVLATRAALTASHYEALIEAYIKSGDLKTSLRILTVMAKAGHDPTESHTRELYLYLTKARNVKHIETAWGHLVELHEEGHAIPIAAVHVILEACMRNADHSRGIDMYKRLHTIVPTGPNVTTFNILFQGMHRGSGTKPLAMFLAAEMGALSIAPNEISYDRLILVCLKEDDYEDAFRYLEELEAEGEGKNGGAGWWMRTGTAAQMVVTCVAKGDKRAWDIMRKMERRGMETANMRMWVEKHWKGDLPDEVQATEKNAKLSAWAYS